MYTLGAMLFKMIHKVGDRHSLVLLGVIVALHHLHERPLRPFVEFRIACTHLTVPVVAETYLVELAAVTRYIVGGSLFRMLTCLYGILLGRKSVSVIAHRVEHIETLQTFIT